MSSGHLRQKPVAKPRVCTGVPGLDDVLSGGLPMGHLYLIEGDPGAGKTTVGLQFLMQGAAQGERVLYVTLSESKAELECGAESHGWSLQGVEIYEFAPTEQSLEPEDQYSHFHPSEVEFQYTTQSILDRIKELKPQRVVFDSLSELRLLAHDSLRFRRQILALKHFFMNRGCTVLLLDDRTADGRDMQLQSIAHGVLMLERLQREYGVERRRLRIAKLRGSRYREGFHDYTIEEGGVSVFPRLVAGEHRQEATEGVASSGIPVLDRLWDGGVPRGTSTLLVGPAGTGKSSIATKYVAAAAERGEVAAIFNFDETLATVYLRAAHIGADLRPHVQAGMVRITQLDPSEVSPGQFVGLVRSAVEQDGARVIVIDSLNGFLNAMSGEQMLVSHVHELLTFLNQRGVVTFVVLTFSGMIGTQLSVPIDMTYLSDNVLVFRFFETQGRLRKALSVVKKRSGKHEDTIHELTFSSAGISLSEPLFQFAGILSGVPTEGRDSSAGRSSGEPGS
jgi:circadian clock protein KaiC